MSQRSERTCQRGQNDLLDSILDGKPVFIVDSPRLQEQLRRRSDERVNEYRSRRSW